MKKYLISIFVLLSVVGYGSVVYADQVHGEIIEGWGITAPKWDNNKYCYGKGVDAFGVGAFDLKINHTQWRKFLRGHLGESAVYYVARKLTDKGGYFCATVVDADRSKGCTQRPYLRFYEPAKTHCFWACADGSYGEDCSKSDAAQNLSDVDASEYDVHGEVAVKILGQNQTAGGSIHDSIPYFYKTSELDCGGLDRTDLDTSKYQEVKIVLALKYTKAENSDEIVMIAQPMGVRAGGSRGCEDKGDYHAWPMVGFIGTEKYVCPEGFMPNKLKGGKGCIRSTEASRAVAHLCDTEPKSKYDKTIHKTESVSGNCQVIRCKSGGFSDLDTRACEPCANTPKEGVHTQTGVCIKCETGEVFNGNSCQTAQGLSKTAMKYGKGQESSTDIDAQCWAKDSPDDYKLCIEGTL